MKDIKRGDLILNHTFKIRDKGIRPNLSVHSKPTEIKRASQTINVPEFLDRDNYKQYLQDQKESLLAKIKMHKEAKSYEL